MKTLAADLSDRIIAAWALAHSLALVSREETVRASGEVPCIW